MLSDAEYEAWCSQVNLSEIARTLVAQIRTSEPVRRVGGGYANVCGRYPSLKMGKTIQFESHKVELPAVEAYEADEEVLEYYDQPFQFKLSYTSIDGRTIRCQHVPDFLVLRRTTVGFEEWKPEKQLVELSQKQPNHYHQDAVGKWHNPPAETETAVYGITYRLRLDSEINWIAYRNRQFLRSYLDGSYPVSESVKTALIERVTSTPALSITQLLQCTPSACPDDIHALMSTGQLYFDKGSILLTEPTKVQLFRNLETAEAYRFAYPLHQEIPAFEQPVLSHSKKAWEQFVQASPEDLRIANDRYRILETQLQNKLLEQATVSARTIRRWKQQFKVAQQLYDWGYLGLLPHQSERGNHVARVAPDAWELIDKVIEDHYETLQQKGKMAVYGILVREWEKANRSDACPSHVTFYHHLNQQDQYKQTKKRQGVKAAYQKSTFYWELNLTTPHHGDRPLEICHIDHTELDIELVCSRTGELLGRPWATVLLDAFSRRVLALYLSFECPSYRACMMVLRICVQRFERFPETIVVDHGAEFDSVYFETLLATFNCTKKQRPPARPRFGSVMERFFGTTNSEFLYTLSGNTQMTKQVRQVTCKNSPKTQAAWNLGDLYTFLCEYAYEVYDQLPHPALGQGPRAAFAAGVAQSGNRPQKKVASDFTFQVLTFPSTPKGIATVQASRGIRIKYLNYWAIDDCFLTPDVEGTEVPVRYDPFDVGTAYAYVKGRWVRCISEYHALFQGRSEQEIKVISAELRQQMQQHTRSLPLRAKTIASYLESTEASEAIQLQRLKDLAATDVHYQMQSSNNSHLIEPTVPSLHSQAEQTTKEDYASIAQGYLSKGDVDLTQIRPYAKEDLWK
jgi:putative transposase